MHRSPRAARLARVAALLALAVPVVATAEVRKPEPGTTIDPMRAAVGEITLGQEVPAIRRGLSTMGLLGDCLYGKHFPRRASQIRRQYVHRMYCIDELNRVSSPTGFLLVSRKPPARLFTGEGKRRFSGEPRVWAVSMRGLRTKWPRTESGIGVGSTRAATRDGLPANVRCGGTSCAVVTCRGDRPMPGRITRFGFGEGYDSRGDLWPQPVSMIHLYGNFRGCFTKERIAEEIGARASGTRVKIDPREGSIGARREGLSRFTLGQDVAAVRRTLGQYGAGNSCQPPYAHFPARANAIRPGQDGARHLRHALYCFGVPKLPFGRHLGEVGLEVSNERQGEGWADPVLVDTLYLQGKGMTHPRTSSGVGMGSTRTETQEGLPDARCGSQACAVVTCDETRATFPGRVTSFHFGDTNRVSRIRISGSRDGCVAESEIQNVIGA